MYIEIPSKDESKAAEAAARSLAKNPKKRGAKLVALRLVKGPKDPQPEEVQIPVTAYKIFILLLSEMARGNAVTLMPIHAELTTQEAADILNVSRPYLIQLLERGELKYRKVGKHRRVLAKHLFEYKRTIDQKREGTLNELTHDAQRLGLDY